VPDERRFVKADEHTPSGGRSRASRTALPLDLLEKSRARLKLLALLFLIAETLLVAVDLPVEGARVFVGGSDEITRLAIILMSAAVYGASRMARIPSQTVLHLGLAYEIVLCLLISMTVPLASHRLALEIGTPERLADLLPFVSWTTPIIVLFPLIVPSPPRTTLSVAIAAALTVPLGLAVLDLTASVTLEPRAYPHTFVSPAIAVAVAYFGSRVVYDLGLDVSRARQMGSYRLTKLLGRGGMGEVWKGEHRMLARPAAVKLIRPDVFGAIGTEEVHRMLARFEREAQTTASLRSPHTIELYDFGVASDGTFYYVAELLDGFDCDALVDQFGPLPPERAVHVLAQVCESLAEAHDHGFTHRDIKPANVFVCRYGRTVDFAKVLDFGLVKPSGVKGDEGIALTVEGMVSGTPAFMAPEQVLGNQPTDARSDIYAVGCLAYWLLTGQLVFTGATAMEVMLHHAHTEPDAPSGRTELAVPPSLDDVVLACLAKDPVQRPQTADELAARLGDCAPHLAEWTAERAREWWDSHVPMGDPGARLT
jgi:hypothetical protein